MFEIIIKCEEKMLQYTQEIRNIKPSSQETLEKVKNAILKKMKDPFPYFLNISYKGEGWNIALI